MTGLTLEELAGICNGLKVLAQHVYSTDTRRMLTCYQAIDAYLQRAVAGEDIDLMCKEVSEYIEQRFPALATAALQFVDGVEAGPTPA